MLTRFGPAILAGLGHPSRPSKEREMAGDAARWCSYDEAADLLGLSPEATKRLALRGGWAKRAGPSGGMLVAVPETIPGEAEFDEGGPDRSG